MGWWYCTDISVPNRHSQFLFHNLIRIRLLVFPFVHKCCQQASKKQTAKNKIFFILVCILCKISRHHPRHYPIYGAYIFRGGDGICHEGHNRNNNVYANICYANQSCHKKDYNSHCLFLSRHDFIHIFDSVCNNCICHACVYRKSLLSQGPNRHFPSRVHIICNSHLEDCCECYTHT